MSTAWINGDFVATESAHIGVTDIGFNFGAGVYEVVNVYEGKPYRLNEHLLRFDRSAKEIGLLLDIDKLISVCCSLIEINRETNAVIYIQATLGDYGFRTHLVPTTLRPTLVAFTQSAPVYKSSDFLNGIRLISTFDLRWGRCDIKCTSLCANLLAANEATRAGVEEAVFVSQSDQTISECATSNIFALKNGVLYTAPAGPRILSGITRETIIRLASTQVPLREEFFSLSFLKNADEVFISSTTREIMPVKMVDNVEFSTPGPMTLKLMKALVTDVEEQTGIIHPKRTLF
jgi:D-alanine transaminase